MGVSLSKNDIVWSYIGQFFKLASGILILPIVLRMLSTEEIALNYLLGALGALVALFDFGFSPQFGRNITYVFSGAQEIKKEGLQVLTKSPVINYKLLVNIIGTAKYVYLRIALIITVFLITFGTWYIYKVTDGFTSVDNVLFIWIITVTSSFFNFYFAYFDSLLIGRGLVKEANKGMIFSKIVYLSVSISTLFMGFGLVGVSIASLMAAFVYRTISYHYFYDKAFLKLIDGIRVDIQQRKELFVNIWHNSRKLGLVLLSGYAINNLGMFLSGLYLNSEEIASYGILRQLIGVIGPLASTLFISYNPTFSALRVAGDKDRLIRVFAFTMNVYYLLFIPGALFLIFFGPAALQIIGSQALLPSTAIMCVYSLVVLLEGNHSCFATLIVTDNKVPFFKSSLIAGAFVVLGDYIALAYTGYGIMGLILAQGIVQLCYANWKWSLVVCQEFSLNFLKFLQIGFDESIKKVKNIYA